MSATNRPAPVSSAGSSVRGTGVPTSVIPPDRSPGSEGTNRGMLRIVVVALFLVVLVLGGAGVLAYLAITALEAVTEE